jgi:3-oxoacyl-[acyl-carrier-protein] synthase-1
MTTGGEVYVGGLGAATPIGRDVWSSAAAVRAGIAGFAQHPYMIDSAGEPMIVAMVPWLDRELPVGERCKALLFGALDQALHNLSEHAPEANAALAVAMPAPRPGINQQSLDGLIAAVKERYAPSVAAFAVFPNGHAAGHLALAAAFRQLSQGSLAACIIAGVDSYICPQTLEWLERCEQLHGAGSMNNAWGFIPGEAAGAVLLVAPAIASKMPEQILAQVLGVGVAVEPNRQKTETVCIGEGLTAAFRKALAALQAGEQVTDVYCDMNGEPYRADEYGFTCLRTKEYFRSAAEFVAPADCWGDVSAAGMPLHMALAAVAGAKGYANGSTACVWASSEDGHRGMTVLRVKVEQDHVG